jgi:hypothetical protein
MPSSNSGKATSSLLPGLGVSVAVYGCLILGAVPIREPPLLGSPLHHCALKVNVPELAKPGGLKRVIRNRDRGTGCEVRKTNTCPRLCALLLPCSRC